MTTVEHVTPEELRERKAAILTRIGMSEDELRERVAEGSLVGDEWLAWNAIESIDYLLG